jgi:hypothetical protein
VVNVQRWSALGAGLCAALVLVAGCQSGGGIGGIGTAAADGQRSSSGSTGSGCQFSTLTSCLMPKPDDATTPQGDWNPDGVMGETNYVKWFSDEASTQSQISDELKQDDFTGAAHLHWQGSHNVTAEIVLVGFRSASGATEWIDADNKGFADDSTIKKLTSPSIPGIWMFDYQTPNSDGSYSTAAIGRFGSVVLEFYVYSSEKHDPLAENQLASWAAVQAGILKRGA